MRRGVLAGARAWAAPIAVITIVGISLSLSYPLFALLLERLGASGFAIGMTSTVAAVAMVASAPVMPIVLDRIGLVRLLVISTVGMAVLILLIPIWHNIWWWTLLRLLSGAFGTALFFASEFWIIAAAPPARRGRIVAVYAIALSGSYWLGPELLRATGIDGWLPFLTAAGVVLLGLPALWWGRNDAPEAVTETRPKFSDSVKFFKSDPAVLYGVLLFGIIEFGAMALISVWSVRVGLDEDAALLLMARLALGAMLFQLPIGWAADRFDRRGVLALAGFCSVLAPLAMIAVAPLLPALIACVVVWGGMAVALYSVALVELGARYSGAELARANAAVMLAYGLGAFLAPALMGIAMDLVPPHGLLWLAALFASAYTVLVVVRRQRARRDLEIALDSNAGDGR